MLGQDLATQSVKRRKRHLLRWFYHVIDAEQEYEVAGLVVGIVAVLFLVGVAIYQVSLFLGRHP